MDLRWRGEVAGAFEPFELEAVSRRPVGREQCKVLLGGRRGSFVLGREGTVAVEAGGSFAISEASLTCRRGVGGTEVGSLEVYTARQNASIIWSSPASPPHFGDPVTTSRTATTYKYDYNSLSIPPSRTAEKGGG